MSPPCSGSFAVTLRVGQPQQEMLPGMDDRDRIINEVIYNLSLLNENRINDLRSVIPEKEYFESFLGVAKSIAPDGNNVKMVGVTALREGSEVSVGFSIVNKDIKLVVEDEEDVTDAGQGAREVTQIIGELLIGDAIKNRIQVRDDNNRRYTIEVSEAIAEDVVRPYFGTRVIVDVVRTSGRNLRFRDINPYDS